jgi:hypothetical protein
VSSNLEELAAAFRNGIREIENAQSAVTLARDRIQSALYLVGSMGEGSGNPLVAGALERCAAADIAQEENLGMLVAAADQLAQYLEARGI